MEGDDGEPPARRQHALGRLQRALQLAELVVDGDAQGLERAGRGVDLVLLGPHHGADDVGELLGRGDRCELSRGDDGLATPRERRSSP